MNGYILPTGDLVIFDEYHFGAWKENARKLFEQDEDNYDEDLSKYDRGNAYDETWLPDYNNVLSVPVRHAVPGAELRASLSRNRIYNWTLLGRAAGQGKLGGRG